MEYQQAHPYELQALLRSGKCDVRPRSHRCMDLRNPDRRNEGEGLVGRGFRAVAEKGFIVRGGQIRRRHSVLIVFCI